MGRLPDVEIQHLETEIENLDDKTKIWEGNKDLSNKQELR